MVYRNLYMDIIKRSFNNGLIKIITGVRRSGKSFLLNTIKESLLSNGVEEEDIIFIDLELPEYNYFLDRKDLDNIILPLLEKGKNKKYVLIDEIQNINNWEKSINAYYKAYDVDIFITGSNSRLLSKELATYLTGRYMEIKIYPFSFNEFLEYKKELNAECVIENNLYTPLENMFEEYFQYGGLPLTVSNDIKDKKTILQDLYSSIFLHDIVERYNIRNTGLLNRITKYLIENTGNLISANSIYKYLKHENIKITTNTVYNYLEYLENAYFISKVTREDIIGLKEISSSEKYYLIDQGFYKSKLEEKQENKGHLLENIIYLELLRKGYKITVGTYKNYEIDFIARKDNDKIYIQVSYNLSNKKTLEREIKPLLSIQDNYPKYLISMDRENYSTMGIKHVNAIHFLTES